MGQDFNADAQSGSQTSAFFFFFWLLSCLGCGRKSGSVHNTPGKQPRMEGRQTCM